MVLEPTTGIILAGGMSRRLGRDKVWEELAGQPLLQHVVDALESVCVELLVVTREGQALPTARAAIPLRVVNDLYPGRGPVGGLHAGLAGASYPLAVVVGCDMPFLSPSLLRRLISLAEGYDLVVPVMDDRPQTLHAVYRRTCILRTEQLLGQDVARLRDLLSVVNVRRVGEDELRLLDSTLRSFTNVNTSDALDAARRRLEPADPNPPGGEA